MQTANQTEVNKAGELAGNAVIRVEDVHKYYELGETRVHALRGVSLEIRRGEFVAIMGASGPDGAFSVANVRRAATESGRCARFGKSSCNSARRRTYWEFGQPHVGGDHGSLPGLERQRPDDCAGYARA